MLLSRFLTCVLLSLAVTTLARAEKAAIRAPVKCSGAPSCGADLSLDEAKDSYRKVSSRVSEFKTLTRSHFCNVFATRGRREYYWAPLERFSDGEAALKVLRSHAQDGKPFNGHVVVESDNSTDSEQHLALCRVSQVFDAFGPPRQCVTVAIVTPNETWLRGLNDRVPCNHSATFRNSGAIDITFNVQTKTNPLDVSAALIRVLKSDFDLSAEQEVSKSSDGKIESIYVRSSGSLRDSKILPAGWREALDFDFHIASTNDGISIRGAAHALVCRQALGSVVDYRGPDDSQRAAYASALDSGVDSAIRASCKKYQKQDAKTIVCD